MKLKRSVGDQTKEAPGFKSPMAAISSSMPKRRSIGITAGTRDSPTTNSGRRPCSKSVTSAPRRANMQARADPDGPEPKMATRRTLASPFVSCSFAGALIRSP